MFLRLPAVETLTGLKRSTIYARIKSGTFPKPYSLGANSSGWLKDDLDRWVAAREVRSPRSPAPVAELRERNCPRS